jgi:hypothetical protein
MDFYTKKSVHINLSRDTHTEFRVEAVKNGLSMQEIFEEMAVRVVQGDFYMCELIENLVFRKRGKISQRLPDTDAESIFKAIETSGPISLGIKSKNPKNP